MRQLLPTCAFALGVLVTSTAVVAQDAGPAGVIKQLERMLAPNRDERHLDTLAALRQLDDPALGPVFSGLVHDQPWPVQVHAVLALAELEEPPDVDAWLIRQVHATARETIIAEALDSGMLSKTSIADLVAWDGLEPLARLLLIGEAIAAGEPVAPEALHPHVEHADLQIALLAAAFLAETGDASALNGVTTRLRALDDRVRRGYQLGLLDAARQYDLDAITDWVEALVDDEDAGFQVTYWGVYTLLRLDTDRGLKAWQEHLGDDPSLSRLVRYGLLLARTEPPLPPATYDRLASEEPLLVALANAGRAMGGQGDPSDTLEALIDLDHLSTIDWAIAVAKTLDDDEAADVYVHLIDRIEGDRRLRQERTAHAIQVVELLHERRPQLVLDRLVAAEDDSLTQQAILIGLFSVDDPAIGEAASKLRRIGSGTADSMALLLIARDRETLDADDLAALRRIANGGGRVSGAMQAQAAWLYLRHVNATGDAIDTLAAP